LLPCLGLSFFTTWPLQACGDFRLPKTHFEGVSEAGFVSHWEQLGNLDLGDIKVPLIVGFRTYDQLPSKELGAGWIMPLLDANIVARDENNFDMVQPDGHVAIFNRDGSNPVILHGSSGYLAEIQGDNIIVHSTCGSGWKMVFTKGKLTSLSKGSHELSITRDEQGRVTEVRDGLKPVMTLEADQVTGLAKSITVGDTKKYQFSYDAKPRVETIQGQNMVSGVGQSLHEIIYPDGKKETFDFAVTDKLLPDLKITDMAGNERIIIWDIHG